MRRLLALTLGLALAIGGLPAAAAQTSAGSAIITDVDTSAFPDITLYAAVTDNLGRPVLGLTDFGLSENGQPVAASVSETIAGAQIVFLLDPNGAFKVRDEAGVTRLDFIKQGLGAFAQTGEWMRDEFDEVTIITPEGVLLPEAGRGGDVAAAVNGYDTDFSGAPDSLALLNQGLDYASAATPRPGMHRVLIVLSNGLGADLPDDVLNRAAFSRTRIHTLFVGPAGDAEIVGAQRLRRLAAQTGGLGLLFDGPASLTPVFQAVADARAQYQLTYRSGLNTTSENRLALRVALPEGGALEAGATFQLRVEPPVISLLLPSQIALGGLGAEPLPVPYELTFPDGHPRGIRSAQLVVDGEVVRQQIDPDGVIFWPLEADAAAMTRTVQIRLTDVWGIEAESAAVIVSLEAALAPASAEAANGQGLPPGLSPAQWGMLAVGLLLLLTAAGLGAGWVVHLRRRRAAAPRRRLGQETIPGVPL